jgi:hypothetical protein
MRTTITRAATAAIALAMVGGAGLAAATHAAAATTSYTCESLVFTQPPVPIPGAPKVQPELIGTGCNVPGKGNASGRGKTVTGQVVGWGTTLSFSYTASACPVHGNCTFTGPKLLPMKK